MKTAGYSVGISDLIANENTNKSIINVITEKKTEVKNLIDQTSYVFLKIKLVKSNKKNLKHKLIIY